VSVEVPADNSATEANTDRHPSWVVRDKDDAVVTSLPPSPNARVRPQNSPRKSLSPDLTMSKDPAGRRHEDSRETGRVEDSDGLLELRKSNSVVARVSMFAQLEEDMKKAATEAKATKLPKGTSNRSAARREHLSQSCTRFATQPVTVGEVQEAVRSAISRDVSSTVTGTSLSKVFFFNLCGGTLVTAATTGLLYQPRMVGDGDCGEIGGMKIGRGNRSTRRKHTPAPLCPPQIPHD
jgi:hypothetical protein